MKKTYSLVKKRGYYQAIVYFREKNGKRNSKWISLGIHEDEEDAERRAREKLERIRADYDGLDGMDAYKTPFSTYLLKWLEYERAKCAVTTVDEYERMVKKYIQPYFDGKGITLAGLNAGHLEDYYRFQQQERGLSAASVIKQHAIIHTCLRWAVKHRWIRENVADLADRPKKAKPKREEPYTVDEVAALLDTLEGQPLYVPVMLAAVFGLRRSEALGLRWSAIDWDNKTLSIDTTVVRQHQGEKVVTTVREEIAKTVNGIRILPLSDIMLRRFQNIRQRQQQNRELLGDAYEIGYLDFVCVNQYGRLINPDYVTQAFSKHLKKYGLRHIRYHDLRHGCASILFDLGYSVKAVQTWMGHSNFNYTADVYIHTNRATHREMANQIAMEIFTKQV